MRSKPGSTPSSQVNYVHLYFQGFSPGAQLVVQAVIWQFSYNHIFCIGTRIAKKHRAEFVCRRGSTRGVVYSGEMRS